MNNKYCYNKDGWCDEDNCRCNINYYDTPAERTRLGKWTANIMGWITSNKEVDIQKIPAKVWDENFPTRDNAVQDSGFRGIID